jgi:hypothetical protein
MALVFYPRGCEGSASSNLPFYLREDVLNVTRTHYFHLERVQHSVESRGFSSSISHSSDNLVGWVNLNKHRYFRVSISSYRNSCGVWEKRGIPYFLNGSIMLTLLYSSGD